MRPESIDANKYSTETDLLFGQIENPLMAMQFK